MWATPSGLLLIIIIAALVVSAVGGQSIPTCTNTFCSLHGVANVVGGTCACTCDMGYGGSNCERTCPTYDPYRGDPMSNPLAPPNTSVTATLNDGIVAITVAWHELPVPAAAPGLVLMRPPAETGPLSAITNETAAAFWARGTVGSGTPGSCALVTTASMPLSSCELCTSETKLTFRCDAYHGALARLPGPLHTHYIASWSLKEFHFTYPVMVESRDGNRVQVATLYCGTTPDTVSCLLYVAGGVSLGVPSVVAPSWVRDCVLRSVGAENLTYVDCVAAPPQLPHTANMSLSIAMSSRSGGGGGNLSTSVARLQQPINIPMPRGVVTIANSGLSVVGGGTEQVVHLGNANVYELVLSSTVGPNVAPDVLTVSLQSPGGAVYVVARECWRAVVDAARAVVTVRWDVGCSAKRNNTLVGVAWTVVVTTRLYVVPRAAGGAARTLRALSLDQQTVSVMVGSVVVDDDGAQGEGGVAWYGWAAVGVAGVAVACVGAVAWRRRGWFSATARMDDGTTTVVASEVGNRTARKLPTPLEDVAPAAMNSCSAMYVDLDPYPECRTNDDEGL